MITMVYKNLKIKLAIKAVPYFVWSKWIAWYFNIVGRQPIFWPFKWKSEPDHFHASHTKLAHEIRVNLFLK